MGSLLEGLAELLFPTRCGGCDRPGVLLCDDCRERLARIDPASACPRCGAPRNGSCTECGAIDFAFSAARCFGLLAPPLSRLVTVHKDGGERRLGDVLGEFASEAAGEWGAECVVCAVPAAPSALRRRGFDHVSRIAECVAAVSGSAALPLLLRGDAADQRTLDRASRRANACGSFMLRTGIEVPERVLLVDDVLTTGSTLDAAARVLLEAGGAEVRAVAVARACSPRP